MLYSFLLLSIFHITALAQAQDVTSNVITNTTPEVLMASQKIYGIVDRDIEHFRGIPFAEPPVGDLRFRSPVKFSGNLDGFNASKFGLSCISKKGPGVMEQIAQLKDKMPPLIAELLPKFANNSTPRPESEDCLTLNVFRPQGFNYQTAKYPVMVSIYGGSFQTGDSQSTDPTKFILESVKMNQPVIYVTFNYRTGPWGFLGGDAISNEKNTNNGLRDQRLALQWVQDNIEYFGGIKTKVTIVGESAGAMSIAHQMVAYNGNNDYNGGKLFSAAILQSGGVTSMRNTRSKWPKLLFQSFSSAAGCNVYDGDESRSLACLRSKSTADLIAAQNSPEASQYFDLVGNFFGWSPHPDNDFIPRDTIQMLKEGAFTQVPYITGTQEDEGTLFAFSFKSIIDEPQVSQMLSDLFSYGSIAGQEISTFRMNYPSNPEFGAPFRTNGSSALTPQFKRIGAFVTDFLFETPRRVLLQSTPVSVPHYNYFATPLHNLIPYLGTFHGNDLFFQFQFDLLPSTAYRRYWISFANHYDPNVNTSLPIWTQYTNNGKESLQIELDKLRMGSDDFRQASIQQMIDFPELIRA